MLVKNVNPWPHFPRQSLSMSKSSSISVSARQVWWSTLRNAALVKQADNCQIVRQAELESMQCEMGSQRTGCWPGAEPQRTYRNGAGSERREERYLKVSSEKHSGLSSPGKSESQIWRELQELGSGVRGCVENKLERLFEAISKGPWLRTSSFRSKGQRGMLRCLRLQELGIP